jgi:hypothetical protein
MVGINERGSRRYVLMIITQQSSEMTIASYLTDPSTGGKRLMEIICERENIRRALQRNLGLFLPMLGGVGGAVSDGRPYPDM